jgi:hypothetical protein
LDDILVIARNLMLMVASLVREDVFVEATARSLAFAFIGELQKSDGAEMVAAKSAHTLASFQKFALINLMSMRARCCHF